MTMVIKSDEPVHDESGSENNDNAPAETPEPPPNDEEDPTEDLVDDPPPDTTPKKRVAITIDDGPYSKYQQKYVDEMKKYGGAATFFIVGNRVEWSSSTGPGLAYAVENGWDVGIHAWTHDIYFNSCSDAEYQNEISKTAAIIQKYIPGYDIKLLRPPGGSITSARVAASPYAIIQWDVDSNDWKYKSESADTKQQNIDTIVSNVMAKVQDGSIILLHELYDNSYLAYCEILKLLDEQGYEFVSVTELLGDKYQAGKTFYSGR